MPTLEQEQQATRQEIDNLHQELQNLQKRIDTQKETIEWYSERLEAMEQIAKDARDKLNDIITTDIII